MQHIENLKNSIIIKQKEIENNKLAIFREEVTLAYLEEYIPIFIDIFKEIKEEFPKISFYITESSYVVLTYHAWAFSNIRVKISSRFDQSCVGIATVDGWWGELDSFYDYSLICEFLKIRIKKYTYLPKHIQKLVLIESASYFI